MGFLKFRFIFAALFILVSLTSCNPLGDSQSAPSNFGTGEATTEPDPITLSVSANVSEILINNEVDITVSNGTSPYTLSIQSGTGTVNNSTMKVTPTASGSLQVKVTDSLNNTGTVTFEAFETRSGVISANETWSGYIKITGDTSMSGAVTINVNPGTKIKFENGSGGDTSFSLNTSAAVKNSFLVNGTSASPVTISSATGTVGYFTSNFYPREFKLNYANLTNIGSASVNAIDNIRPNNGDSITVTNSTFNNCGRLYFYMYNGSTLNFSNNTITNTLHTSTDVYLNGGTGLKTISNNTFDKSIYFGGGSNITFSNNKVFGENGQLSIVVTSDVTIENNIFYYTGTTAGASVLYFDRGRNFTIKGNFIKGGGRVLRYINYSDNGINDQVSTITGNIIEGVSSMPTTNMLESPGKNSVIKDNYFIGFASSSAILIPNVRTGITIRNNTFNVDSTGSFNTIYSLSASTAGVITSGRNNIMIIDTGSPYGFRSQNSVNGEITSATNNYFSFAGTHYFNVTGGTTGTSDLTGSAGLSDQTINSTNITTSQISDETVTRSSIFTTITTALRPLSSSALVDTGSTLDNADSLSVNGRRDIGAGEYSP